MTPVFWRAQLTGKKATCIDYWSGMQVSGNSSTSGTATEDYAQFHLINIILGFSFPSTRNSRQNTRHYFK